MSYYPLLSAPGCSGWVTLCNYSPNNWELRDVSRKHLNVTWCENSVWVTKTLGTLGWRESKTIHSSELELNIPNDGTPFLSLSTSRLPPESKVLPGTEGTNTFIPRWRSALGLSSNVGSTSYQGEIDPFPVTGSLLTFFPFFQKDAKLENYVLLVNMESDPIIREETVEFYDVVRTHVCRGKYKIKSNSVNIIRIDNLGYENTELPLLICKGMSAIPIFFTKSLDGMQMSLEHTHPPASYIVHGNRWGLQKILKTRWFEKTEHGTSNI